MIYQLFNETISDQNDARRLLAVKSAENKRLLRDLRTINIFRKINLAFNIILMLALAVAAFFSAYNFIGEMWMGIVSAIAVILLFFFVIFFTNLLYRTFIDTLSLAANIEEYTRIMGLNHAESVSRIPVVHLQEAERSEEAEEEAPAGDNADPKGSAQS